MTAVLTEFWIQAMSVFFFHLLKLLVCKSVFWWPISVTACCIVPQVSRVPTQLLWVTPGLKRLVIDKMSASKGSAKNATQIFVEFSQEKIFLSEQLIRLLICFGLKRRQNTALTLTMKAEMLGYSQSAFALSDR